MIDLHYGRLILAVPSKLTPPIFLAVSKAVAVAAFPEYPLLVIVPKLTPASENVMVPLSASNVTPPLEFNVTVVPASSAVPSAVIVILAAAPAVSVVVIVNAPLVPAVNTAVSSVSPLIW